MSDRAPAQCRVQRASASFSLVERQVLASTSLNFPPEIHVLTLNYWMLFPKAVLWYNTTPNTLQKCTRAALTNMCYTCHVDHSSFIRAPQASSGLCWHLESLSPLDFSGEKLRENKAASMLREL